MTLPIPCVLVRAGTSLGPFFLRDWLPEGDYALNHALIDAIGGCPTHRKLMGWTAAVLSTAR